MAIQNLLMIRRKLPLSFLALAFSAPLPNGQLYLLECRAGTPAGKVPFAVGRVPLPPRRHDG